MFREDIMEQEKSHRDKDDYGYISHHIPTKLLDELEKTSNTLDGVSGEAIINYSLSLLFEKIKDIKLKEEKR